MSIDYTAAGLSPLFEGIAAGDLPALLDCVCATWHRHPKNSFIFEAGVPITQVGIVLAGTVHVIQEDFWGNRTIVAAVPPGQVFGEGFCCSDLPHVPVSAVAAEAAEILLVDYRKIISPCCAGCQFHSRLIHNMLKILADKTVLLTQKMELITRRTTRDKLLGYLSTQAQLAGGAQFTIPFNRQQLAQYLSVDRSAMSTQLAKMQQEGLLRYCRNSFELLGVPPAR